MFWKKKSVPETALPAVQSSDPSLSIFTIQKVEVTAGDVLLVIYPRNTPFKKLTTGVEMLRKVLPPGIKIITLPDDWKIQSVRKSEHLDADAAEVARLMGWGN